MRRRVSSRERVRAVASRTAVVLLATWACARGPVPSSSPPGTVAPESGAARHAPTAPAWIWSADDPDDTRVVVFRRRFEVASQVDSARLVGAADNHMRVMLDGQAVLVGEEWWDPTSADLTEQLTPGSHVFAVRAVNEGGAAGVLLQLELEGADGTVTTLVTDGTWQVHEGAVDDWERPDLDDSAWPLATIVGALGGEPWSESVHADALADARPTGAIPSPDDGRLDVRQGFAVERLYAAPREQGSWASMCIDSSGRLIVSDERDGGLWRLTVPGPGEPGAVIAEPLPVDLTGSQGMAFVGDALFATGRRPSDGVQGLFRIDDRDADGELDSVTLLKPLVGVGEHGWHAVVPAPDGGHLIVVAGNNTTLPDGYTTLASPHWGEEQLLPRLPDPHGHMTGVHAPGGGLWRVSLDGSDWQLVSHGYRNPYDAAFHSEGELFTFDADMEWDLNAPWYRPTRICLASSGSDYGWRYGSGKLASWRLDTLPPVVDVGLGSPVGVAFGEGSGFPGVYGNALFAADWSHGRVFAVHLTPDGGGWSGEVEPFLRGRPLPVTDLLVHADHGALYLITGGRGTSSGLYRVTATGEALVDAPAPVTSPAGADVQHRRRVAFESAHGKGELNGSVAWAWKALGDDDRFVSTAARVALEGQPVAGWRQRALTETDPAVARSALLALARVSTSDPNSQPDRALASELVAALLLADAADASPSGRLQLLGVLSVTLARFGAPSESDRERLLAHFGQRLPSGDAAQDGELVRLAVFLQSPDVAGAALTLLEAAPTQQEQFDLAMSLRLLDAGWTPVLRERWFDWLGKARALGGGQSLSGYLSAIEADALARLDDQTRAMAEARLAAIPTDATPLSLARELLGDRTTSHAWTVAELLPDARRVLVGERDRGDPDAGGGPTPAPGRSEFAEPDLSRGRQLFAATGCYACHRIAGQGGAVGPDLTGLGARFDVEELLRSILEPSATLSDQYQRVNIFLVGGDVVSGRIVNLNGSQFHVSTDMLRPDDITFVDRRKVQSVQPSEVSPMPEALVDLLTRDEILDLVAWLMQDRG